ncbi:MAG: hypothetical protein HY289_05015 [Planctomycetes bacterium]|nr:hypothetical protein [Planctomycetota bacterium]
MFRLDEFNLARNVQVDALLLKHAARFPQDRSQAVDLGLRRRDNILPRFVVQCLSSSRTFPGALVYARCDRSSFESAVEFIVQPVPGLARVPLSIGDLEVAMQGDEKAAFDNLWRRHGATSGLSPLVDQKSSRAEKKPTGSRVGLYDRSCC